MLKKPRFTDGTFCTIIYSQHLLAIHLADLGTCCLHAGICLHTGSHFLQFESKTSDLHLVIQTSGQADLTIHGPGCHITGIVNLVLCHKRIVPENRFGQFRRIAVTAAHAFAAYVQFAVTAHRKGIHPLIQHVHAAIAHRSSNGNALCMGQFLHADTNSSLRGTVLVINSGITIFFQSL